MKQLKLVVLNLAALVFGRARGFSTANTQAEDIAALQERQDKLEAENTELKKQLSLPPVLDPAPPDGPLALLCKGAGVDLADVRWRMQAGLDAEQAVEAAMAQKQHDKGGDKKAASAKSEK